MNWNVIVFYFTFFIFVCFTSFAQQPKMVLPVGHTGEVFSVKISSDGEKIATASTDRTVKIWDAATGKLLHSIDRYIEWINSIDFSPDGKKIIVSAVRSTTVWDATKGKLLFSLDFAIGRSVFSPDGKKILVASSYDQMVDASTGKPLLSLIGHEFPHGINTAVFSPDGNKIVTASYDSTAKIWDAATGKLLYSLEGNIGGVMSAAFSPDGGKVIIFCRCKTVKVWDVSTGRLLYNLEGATSRWGDDVNSGVFSPDGSMLITAADDKPVKIWDGASGKFLQDMKTDAGGARFAIFSPDGKKIITDNEVLDAVSGNRLYYLKAHTHAIVSAVFSSDGKKIITGSRDNTAKIWDAATGKLLHSLEGHTHFISSAVLSPAGDKLVTTSNDSIAKIWDAGTGKLLHILRCRTSRGLSNAIEYAAFSPDGSKIVTTSTSINVWETGTGKFLDTLESHIYVWRSKPATFSADGKKIFASQGKNFQAWDAENRNTLWHITLKTSDFNSAVFSPDCNKIVTTYGYYHTAKIWGASTGKALLSLEGHTDQVVSAVFSSDGSKIVTASHDKTAKIWEAETGKLLQSVKGSSDLESAGFSPDSKKIVTAHRDGTAKVWDIATGTILQNLEGHRSLGSAFFSPMGNKIVTVSRFETAKIWDAETGKLLQTILLGDSADIQDINFKSNRLIATNKSEIKFCNLATGEYLFKFYPIDIDDYLVVDRDGRYDGTENARKLVYYSCGDEVIDLEQFKDLSWEPDLVSKLAGANKDPITAKKISEINICNFTPEVEERGFNNGIYQYEITPRNGGIGQVQLYVNGKLVKKYDPAALLKKDKHYLLSIPQKEIKEFFISGTGNQVLVKATTIEGTMTSRGVIIEDTSLVNTRAIPNIYVVSIGISNYKGDKLKLGYASKDALDFATVITASAKKLLNTDGKEHISTYTFSTETGSQRWPAKAAIQKTMDSIAQIATADDILIIFFAGHGVLQTGQKNLYLVTAEATSFEQVQTLPQEVAISTDELNEWMRKIKANKQLLILDACNSGQVVQNIQELISKRDVPADQQRALENLKDITGTYILSASAAGQSAYETSLYGQGLLTYSLLSGIKLGDGLKDNKYIDVTKWFNTAKTHVAILAKDIGGRQEPQIMGNASFAVGLVDKEIADGIKLSIKKKIFRRSNLVKEGLVPSDNLGLTGLIDKELNEVSVRGKESPFTYAADNTLLDAYSILGRYILNGNDVKVKIYLMKGIQEDNIVRQFEFSGTIDKKEELAGKIVEAVQQYLK